MNRLFQKTFSIYLAGPINQQTDEDCKTWRDYITELVLTWNSQGIMQLEDYLIRRDEDDVQIKILNPMRRDYRVRIPENSNEVIDLDLFDIKNSDILLAFVPRPSYGTIVELTKAKDWGKPRIVFQNFKTKGEQDSTNDTSFWLWWLATRLDETLDETMIFIMENFFNARKEKR